MAVVVLAACSGSTPGTGDGDPTADAVPMTPTTATLPGPTADAVPPATRQPTATVDRPQEHWISVLDGEWIDRRTGTTFVPRGVNLLRKLGGGGDALFGSYDTAWVDEQLDAIAGQGFNTIRFFLDLCMRCTSGTTGIRSDYLANLTDLLVRMEARGLVALPTSNDVPDPGYSERLPCCEPFGGYRNSLYLSPEGHAIAAEYFSDLIEGLLERNAPLHIVMGWQLANEQFFLRDVPPISLRSGTVTAGDGATYDLADDDAVATMVERNLLAYIARVGQAMRAIDDGALVTIGFFSADEPGAGRDAADNRWVEPAVVLREGAIDFIDLHAYPGLGGQWAAIGPAFGLDEPPTIPLLLGEFGAFKEAHLDPAEAAISLVGWQVESCELGFAGWLAWLWGEPLDPEVIVVNAGDGEIATALSPDVRPDPCETGPYISPNLALDQPVTASQEESEEYGARWVNDGSIRTWWSAADGAPQWVEIDLEAEYALDRVEVLIGDVTPQGRQTHRVYVRADGEAPPGRLAGEASGDVRDRDVLTVEVDPGLGPVRHVRVETVVIDGWVIVHDVAVFGAAAPS